MATDADEAHLGWDFTCERELPYYPRVECLAPELLISNILTVKSDVFSLARLAYTVHRHQAGIRRADPMRSADEYRRFVTHLNLSHSSRSARKHEAIPFEGVPEALVPTLKKALATNEKLRCRVTDIVNCKYLNDMIVRVIRYLERLLDKERDGKLKFFKKLPEVS